VEVLDLYATALLRLGRTEAAQPLLARLLATGWARRELLELCAGHEGC
jgi:hypothetical protein